MPSRRHFLQWAGVGAAASLTAGRALAQATAEQPAAKPQADRGFPLGMASYTLREFSLDQALAMTNRVGLKHICLKDCHLPMNSTPEQLAAAAAKAKAAGLDLYGCGVVYMRKEAEVDQAFEYAKAAGMKMIIGVPPYSLLPLVNEKVQKYDIRVAIHNHGPTDKVYPTPDVAYEKIKGLDRRIGLCIDIGHTCRSGVDASQAAEQFADRLLDIHVKDASAANAKGITVEIGRGVIDIPKFLRTLQKIRYAGIVSFEYEKDGKDPMPGLSESVGYVKGGLAAI
jgi:inosose dehydratase